MSTTKRTNENKARCSGTCNEWVDSSGLPHPDGPGMPHLILCRTCADAKLVEHGLTRLPGNVKGMVLACSLPDFVDPTNKRTAQLVNLIEARAAIRPWTPCTNEGPITGHASAPIPPHYSTAPRGGDA